MLNDEIQAARDDTKSNSYRTDTFQSREYGVLGWIGAMRPTLALPAGQATLAEAAWRVEELTEA